MKILSKKLWLILSVVIASLFAILVAGTQIAYSYAPAINQVLKCQTYEIIDDGDNNEDTQYFKAKYTTAEAIKAYNSKICEDVEGEGLVLLKNEGILPLSKTAKVSLFMTGSVNINDSVQGTRNKVAGASGTVTELATFKEAFEGVGVSVNPTLWNFYTTGAAKNYGGYNKYNEVTLQQTGYINEAPWSVYDLTVKNSFSSYNDAAVVVLTRDATEGADVAAYGSDGANGNYLELSPQELEVLREVSNLRKQGAFGGVVVILNTALNIQLDFLDNPDIAVDSLMWIGNVGMSGIHAVAKALVGDINPSGRLSDTFLKDNFSSPAMAAWVLNPNRSFSLKYENSGDLDNTQSYYGVYNEGIYVGYRYYETRYADLVEGRAYVGTYNYSDVVAYPFGAGISYTSFKYSDFAVTKNDSGFDVSVKVKNTGDRAGKEVVQIYIQKPYTSYSVGYGIEVSAVELAGFGKTEELAPEASETVTVSIEMQSLTSYDTYGAGTYILDEGDFYITAGKNSHDAINSIMSNKGYNAAYGMDDAGDPGLVYKWNNPTRDMTTYSISHQTGKAIGNVLDDLDPNRYLGGGNNIVDYVSRSNWVGTWPEKSVKLTLTNQMRNDLKHDIEPEKQGAMPIMGESNGLTLAMMRGKTFEDDDWTRLLNQMSFDDMNELLTTAYCKTAAISSIAKPQTDEQDGPTYCKEGLTGSRFPCEGIWASTFNIELMELIGEGMANDALYAPTDKDISYDGMWIPGINIHRVPYGGRAHEYFSEDPFLTGVSAAAEIKGVQKYGVIAMPKHYILNDQEANRNGIGIWLNEQEAREVIIRPWMYAVGIDYGNAHGVMSSFNRTGCKWASAHYGLITAILRDEFGFDGFIITDMADSNGASYMSCVDGIMAGTDTWLSSGKNHSFAAYKSNPAVVNAMREASHRICYAVTNFSAAMNGLSSTTQIRIIIPWWKLTLITVDIVLGVMMLTSIGLLTLSWLRNREQ